VSSRWAINLIAKARPQRLTFLKRGIGAAEYDSSADVIPILNDSCNAE
jgi:hypothetical protein